VTQTRDAERGSSARDPRGDRGFFARIALFVRQVIAELRKVVRPTREELIAYTSVVLVFVIAIMVYVSLLDFGLGRLVLWVFGGRAG
jgi:preprotein translocase subunit SecE